MTGRSENVTVVILSEEEAKEISVRHCLRCILRDCWFLARAVCRLFRRYFAVCTQGALYKNHWWMQIKG